METKKAGIAGRRITPRVFVLTIVATAVVVLLVGSQLPRLAVGASGSTPSVLPAKGTGAKLTLNIYVTCSNGAYYAGCSSLSTYPTVSSTACDRAAYQLDMCNVTFSYASLNAPSFLIVNSLNYTAPNGTSPPTNFYFINSDPALPALVNVYSGGGVSSGTISLWFHVTERTGKLSAYVLLNLG